MAELQIKTEYFPARCEVCHQSDCFDVYNNYCSRCLNITNEINISSGSYKANPKYEDLVKLLFGLTIGTVLGMFIESLMIGLLLSPIFWIILRQKNKFGRIVNTITTIILILIIALGLIGSILAIL
jgi:hypothetical protein